MTEFSYQLYSSRNFPPLERTLAMVAGHGYKMVEGYGDLFETPDQAKALRDQLDRHGLRMASAHMALDQVRDAARACEIGRVLGLDAIYVPFIDEADRASDADGWRAYAASLEAAGRPLVEAGFTFGYHNHDFEFAPLAGTDDVGMNLILDHAPSVTWECDTAWVVKGGHDVVAWVERYAPRISAAHLKDIAPDGEAADEDGWADVGHGTMNWGPIRAALSASACALYVMEHDNPKDHDRFAGRSIAAARAQ